MPTIQVHRHSFFGLSFTEVLAVLPILPTTAPLKPQFQLTVPFHPAPPVPPFPPALQSKQHVCVAFIKVLAVLHVSPTTAPLKPHFQLKVPFHLAPPVPHFHRLCKASNVFELLSQFQAACARPPSKYSSEQCFNRAGDLQRFRQRCALCSNLVENNPESLLQQGLVI